MPLLTCTSVVILVKDSGVITPASTQIHTLLINAQSWQVIVLRPTHPLAMLIPRIPMSVVSHKVAPTAACLVTKT